MKTLVLIISALWILLDSAMHCQSTSSSKQTKTARIPVKSVTPISVSKNTDKILVSSYLNTFNTEGFYYHHEPNNEELYMNLPPRVSYRNRPYTSDPCTYGTYR